MTDKWSIAPEAKAEMVAAVREAKESTAQGRFLAAKATGLVVAADAIGEGRTYSTQGDYAVALGVSAATITGLKNLAVAVGLGLTPAHPKWTVISSKAGNIGPACRDPKRSLAKIGKAAEAAKAKDIAAAEAKAKAKAKADAAPRATADEKSEETGTVETGGYADVVAALATLRENVESLTAEEWTAVRNGLTSILADGNAVKGRVAA
jgi:hypothetical protein